jgi:hypothetical protein
MIIREREVNVVDVLVSGFTAFVGFVALNTAIRLSRVRIPGGTLLMRGLIFKLVVFTVWEFEVFGASLYEYRERLSVSSLVQGLTNFDRLTLGIPMAALLVWIIPSAAHFLQSAPIRMAQRKQQPIPSTAIVRWGKRTNCDYRLSTTAMSVIGMEFKTGPPVVAFSKSMLTGEWS